MIDKMRHPDWGTEFDWFALDQQNHVALLTTAGYGPVPARVREQLAVIAQANQELQLLPVVSTVTGWTAANDVASNVNDWVRASHRGLFTYDWQHWNGPYERLSAPANPGKIEQYPPVIRTAARLHVMENIFTGLTSIAI